METSLEMDKCCLVIRLLHLRASSEKDDRKVRFLWFQMTGVFYIADIWGVGAKGKFFHLTVNSGTTV